jgi:YHS domain-containing protein
MAFSRKSALWLAGLGISAIAAAVLAGAARPDDKDAKGDPYSLKTCPISKKELGKDSVAKVYDGREIRFCCPDCVAPFEKNKAAELKKIDEAMIKDQTPFYPGICPTCDHKLSGESYALIYNNRLVLVCNESEKGDFMKDPRKYMEVLDKAVIEAQRPGYKLQTCPVSDEKLGSMGEPVDIVVANRLVRMCCRGCKKDLMKETGKYLAKMDEMKKAPGAAPGEKKEEKKGG